MIFTVLWVQNGKNKWERGDYNRIKEIIDSLKEDPFVSLEDVIILQNNNNDECTGLFFLNKHNERNSVEVLYTSVWNHGSEKVTTKALVDKDTGEVFYIESSDSEVEGTLDYEYITLPAGIVVKVKENENGVMVAELLKRSRVANA